MPQLIDHSRTPMYQAFTKYRLALLAAAGIALPSAAEQETEWDCRPDPKGTGWICDEKEKQPDANTAGSQPLLKADRLGWVEREFLTAAQQQQITEGCCGIYVQPQQTLLNSNQNPATASIDTQYLNSRQVGDITTLSGDIRITQGNRLLFSDHAVIDQKTRIADLHGNIRMSEPGLLLLGDSARLESESGAVNIENATFVFPEQNIRGTADTLTRDTDNQYQIEEATYTSCPPDSNAWQLVTSKVEVDTNSNVATARNVRLEVSDIPILYLPWMRFPVGDERQTGLLFPNLGIGGRNGLDVSLPYYINLAPNYDLTLTPRFIQERGSMLEGEFRHLSSWGGQTTLNTSWLGDDDGGDNSGNNNLESTQGLDRWWVNLNHNSVAGNFTADIDYTEVSDNLYIRDFGSNTQETNSTTHLPQRLQLGYHTEHWDIRLKGEQFQTVFVDLSRPVREPYKQLPRLDANGSYPLGGGLSLNLKNHIVAFDHTDDDLFQTGNRARLDWGVEWDKQWRWGFFKPGIEARHLRYQLDDNISVLADNSPSVTVPTGYLDTGLFFERNGSNFTQTLEPRLYLLYAEHDDQSELPDFDTSEQTFGYSSLWRSNRFSGNDRIGDAKQASLGITTRVLDNSGSVRFNASIGRIFYFEDRLTTLNNTLTNAIINNPLLLDSNNDGTVDLNDGISERTLNDLNTLTRDKSPIAANLMWRLGRHWQLLTDMVWDDDRERVDKGSFALRYNDGDNHILNLGYRFTRNTARSVISPTDPGFTFLQDQTIEQGDISAILPLRGNLKLIGRWNYDFTNQRNLETFAGVEYNSCCWRASLVARRWIERDDLIATPGQNLGEDEGIFFQLQFKGLAGTSSKVDDILTESIYGYQPAEEAK